MHANDKHAQTARDLLELIGGPANITSIAHCISRLRLGVVDAGRIEARRIKDHPAVMGVVEDDTYQIVLGPAAVAQVADAFRILVEEAEDVAPAGESDAGPPGDPVSGDAAALAAKGAAMKAEQKRKNSTKGKLFIRKIANIFVPLIPALIACGVIAGIGGLLNSIALSTHSSALAGVIPVTTALSQGFMSLIAVFVGFNAAKEFGGTPVLGGAVSGIVVYAGVANVETFAGPLKPGQGGVLGALAAAVLCAYLEKWARRWVPDALQALLVPTVAVALSGLAALMILMPVAGEIASGIGNGATWLLTHAGAGAGVILGGLFSTLVMLGLHQALIPIHTTLIEQQGFSALYPILAMAGGGQAGAALAVYLRARHNPSLRRTVKSALPTCVLGVSEPVIYGVTLPLVRPFITAGIGAAVGGGLVGLFAQLGTTTGSTAIGPAGLVLLPLLDGSRGIGPAALIYTVGWFLAAAVACVVTWFFGLSKSMIAELNAPDGTPGTEPTTTRTPANAGATATATSTGTGTSTDLGTGTTGTGGTTGPAPAHR
ncbi:PTS transporter subunit EIIC [Streptomyces celluloflavus]|uniref:PTS transporter subunit EIIC n=1 Tax=Streptomyces celluloflavus TaxID=58344 RepID=UPI00367D801F